MKHIIKIQIPDPCSENWDDFTKTGQGGYCGNCKKEVVDFTSLTNAEIKSYFKSSISASTCGRFRKVSLNKEFDLNDNSKCSHFLKLGVFLITFSTLINIKPIQAQNLSIYNEEFFNQAKITKHPSMQVAKFRTGNTDSLIVKGKVIERFTKLPVVGASIKLKESTIETVSDNNGNFIIKFTSTMSTPLSTLVFQYLGMQTLQFDLVPAIQPSDEIIVEMDNDILMGGYTIVRGNIFQRIWWKIKKMFSLTSTIL